MSFPYPVTASDTYKLVLCRTNGGAVVPGVFTHNRNLWLLSARARSLELELQANTKFSHENLVTLDYENWLLEVAKFISRAAHFGTTDRGGNDYYAGHITDVARRVDEDTNGDIDKAAKLLKEKGAIKDENIFNLYTKITGKSSFKQGRYKFNTENDVKTIVEKLVKGDVNKEEIKLQLLEGKTMTDLAEVVEKVTVNTKEQFLNKMKDKEYIKKLSEKFWFIDYDTVTNKDIYYPLEGYLFPDTYIFDNKEVGIETIIDTMLKHTEKKLVDYKNITDKKKLTIHEVLTLASIIELEAGTSKTKSEEKNLTDREIVAKIFMNRINKKMSLRK